MKYKQEKKSDGKLIFPSRFLRGEELKPNRFSLDMIHPLHTTYSCLEIKAQIGEVAIVTE